MSQAVLQNKPDAPGSLSRVPAAELEALVVAALHKHLERITLAANKIKVRLRQMERAAQDAQDQ